MTTPATLALPAAPDDAGDSPHPPAGDHPRRQRPPEYPPRGIASRRVAALSVGVVVWWQLLALTGLLFGGWATWGQLTVTIACGLVLVASVARWHGRWLPGWLATYFLFRRRARRAADSPATPLAAAGADLETRTYTDRAGNVVGLASDGDCWTSLLRVEPAQSTNPDKARQHIADMLPLLVASHDDGDVRLAAVQLVNWAVAVPVRHTATSRATTDGQDPPSGQPNAVQRQHWVAVRFAPGLAPTAVEARGGGEVGALRATAASALRLAARLTEAGYTVAVCDGADLSAQLATALGVPAAPVDDTTQAPVESWRAWSVGALHQACYRLRRQPRTTAAMAVAAGRVAAAPALFTGTSILLERSPTGEVVSQVLLRIGAPAGPSRTEQRDALRLAATGLGADTVRLDGAHGGTVPATLPLGRRAHV